MTLTDNGPGGEVQPDEALTVWVLGRDAIFLRGLQALLDPTASAINLALLEGFPGPDAIVGDTMIVLADPYERPTEAEAAWRAALERSEAGRYVVFTHDRNEHRLGDALRHGASGFLVHSMEPAALVDALRRIADGETVIDPGVAHGFAVRAASQQSMPTWPGAEAGLTERESEVLGLLVWGRRNSEIAEALFIGSETVKTHVRNVYRKLGVTGRQQATVRAINSGWFA